ncbi:WecB/TagA/CpsF family glycosyltransferase [Rhodanobacter sp. FDAARGOS 1247]|nr:WecB/TagA/CpsF family glycosyltransferase [Rhodanobacter sp. FDAARGOS 1247]
MLESGAHNLNNHEVFILGAKAHAITMEKTIKYIIESISEGKFIQHSVINVAKVVAMKNDASLRESVNSCDLINIDGAGIVLAGRLLGMAIPERVAGIDLFYNLLREASVENIPVFLLGARQNVVDEVKRRATMEFSGIEIVGHHHGYFETNEEGVVELIASSGAKMLFVAMTSPLKENFINKWKSRLGVSFAMGVGGSFDVYAGLTRRAPPWMQKAGLEWLFRTMQEPRRMWRRYLFSNLKFAKLLLSAILDRVAAKFIRSRRA